MDRAVFDPQQYFSEPLTPLVEPGSRDPARVLVPSSEIGRDRIGVTSQFLEQADDYHRKYTDTAYFRFLLAKAIETCGLELAAPVILDIGSGSGNSVFPCLELFESPRIIATDISPNLLKILALHVEKIGCSEQVVPVCMDATRDLYRADSFDLVVGAAILHHLINPEDALVAACRALKKGGHAIFFEPFEAGNAVLRLAYAEILRQSETGCALEPEVARVLAALVLDTEVRSGTDKSDEIFGRIDDKWLFTRHYIEEIAARSNVSDVTIYPLHGTESPFSEQTRTNLRLAAGLAPEALDAWAWDILEFYDSAFSADLKSDLMIEGAIILTI